MRLTSTLLATFLSLNFAAAEVLPPYAQPTKGQPIAGAGEKRDISGLSPGAQLFKRQAEAAGLEVRQTQVNCIDHPHLPCCLDRQCCDLGSPCPPAKEKRDLDDPGTGLSPGAQLFKRQAEAAGLEVRQTQVNCIDHPNLPCCLDRQCCDLGSPCPPAKEKRDSDDPGLSPGAQLFKRQAEAAGLGVRQTQVNCIDHPHLPCCLDRQCCDLGSPCPPAKEKREAEAALFVA